MKKAVAGKAAAGRTAVGRTAAARKPAAGKKAAEKADEKKVDEKAAGKKTVEKKAAARKTAAARTAAGKSATGRPAAGKAAAAGAAGAAAPAEGGEERRTAATEAAARKTTAGKATAEKVGAAQAAKQTGATTVVAKKTPGTVTAAESAVPKARGTAVEPGDLPVRPGEEPWTVEEVAQARAELETELERLRTEIASSEASLAGLMRESGDGAGDDQADTGTKNITREHEMALTANAREMLTQVEHALQRLDAGTYGLCENCGKPIGKARMQAFPRATLCVECKQKQERR
ncbi:TraR/DksA family transcriptional regulator [Streptomyces echinoruber]|uniref:TraR/DksA family transcriptional regulator n=1 Tax=Streptomyces echinoruber TaxID=68898 RepID=UPI00360F7827